MCTKSEGECECACRGWQKGNTNESQIDQHIPGKVNLIEFDTGTAVLLRCSFALGVTGDFQRT